MKTSITSLLLLLVLSGCQFSKSIKKDLVSGMITKGDGLSCEDVYLSVNNEKTSGNSFNYGEQFFVNFNNIEGFTKENDNVFPGMKVIVVSSDGDTVLQTGDLYSGYAEGIDLSPLLLSSDLTVASPMRSTGEYILNINIWDKKGNGKFSAKFDFKVKSNELIQIDVNNVTFNEIYLFSEERGKVISDNKIRLNEHNYIIFEGLSGFKESDGKVFPGLSLKATDNTGAVILDYEDLFSDYSVSGLDITDFFSHVSSNFILSATDFKNPFHFVWTIWDKKSDAQIEATADLNLE